MGFRSFGINREAAIDIELFRTRTFSVATATQFLSNGIAYCGQLLVPLYLISGAWLSPSDAVWVLSAVGSACCAFILMGNLTDRFGCRSVLGAGVIINCLGTLPFLWMSHGEYSIPIAIAIAIAGLLLRGKEQGATGIPSIAAA